MRIFSMTGYGKGVSEIDSQKVTIEIKTVNHRFLDLGVKLPKGFTFAEDLVRRLIKSKAVRGHFDVFVNAVPSNVCNNFSVVNFFQFFDFFGYHFVDALVLQPD